MSIPPIRSWDSWDLTALRGYFRGNPEACLPLSGVFTDTKMDQLRDMLHQRHPAHRGSQLDLYLGSQAFETLKHRHETMSSHLRNGAYWHHWPDFWWVRADEVLLCSTHALDNSRAWVCGQYIQLLD